MKGNNKYYILGFVLLLLRADFAICTISAQSCICNKSYETDLGSLIIKPDSFQLEGDWLSSIEFNRKKMSDSVTDYTIYRLASSYSMIYKLDSAYKFLSKFIDISNDDRCIIVDEKFNNLKEDSLYWASIMGRIEHGYLMCLDSLIDKEFALKLFFLGTKDQKYRKYYPKLQQSFELSEWNENDMQNQATFTLLEKKHGFPTLSKVGRLASNAGFLIIQHGNTKYRHYRKLVKAYKKGDYESILYAKATDRWRTEHHKKQVYGTSWYRSYKTTTIYGDKWVLEPVKDFKNLNKRRLLLGFCPIEEELSKDPSKIIPNEYYKR